MENYKIISKVNYSHNQNNACVLLKQFLIAQSNGQKILLLKMQNNFSQRLNSIKYKITQLTAKGEEIKTIDFSYADFQVSPKAIFVPYKSMILDKQCVDIKAELVQAVFENHIYNLDKSDVNVIDSNKENTSKVEKDFYIRERKPKSPKLLTVLSTVFFAFLTVVTYFTVENYKNTHYTFSIDDFEYKLVDSTFSTDGDIILTKYKGRARNIKIPNKILEHYVIGIADEAFANTSIEKVVIDTELESFPIGNSAFKDCKKLKSISLGNVDEIGDYAFAGCELLEKLESNKILEIGNEAFVSSGINSIVLNGSSSLHLGTSVFKNCRNLTSVQIDQFIRFNNDNFSFLDGCFNVESLSLVNNALDDKSRSYSVLSMFNYVTPKLKDLSIENVSSISESFCKDMPIESINIVNLQSDRIDDYAFSNCTKLTVLNLPIEIKEVGDYAFSNTSLSKFEFDKLESIGKYAFSNTPIKSVKLNKNIKNLEEGIFADCQALSKVTFEGQIIDIPNNLFLNCISLDSLIINSDVIETIGTNAFSGCSSLSSFDIGEDVNSIGSNAFSGCSSLKIINIPSKISKIENGTFASCSSLERVMIESNSNLSSIGQSAFDGCVALEEIDLQNVSYLSSIGSYAFSNCINLKLINLPHIVSGILPERVFYNCSSLESFELPVGVHTIGKSAFENCFKLSGTIFNGEVAIIDSRAFANCISLQTIQLPISINTLGENIFSGCNNVSTLEVPFAAKDKSSPSSMTYLFEDISSLKKTLKEVKLLSAERLDTNAFNGFTVLESILLPENLTSIGSNAFRNCKKLRKLVIGANVEILEDNILEGCNSIEELSIPFIGYSKYSSSNLQHLFGYNGAKKLNKLELTNTETLYSLSFDGWEINEITFSDTLTSVESYAFQNITGLKSLTIPTSVTGIGNNILYGCFELEYLSIPFIGNTKTSAFQLSNLFDWDMNQYSIKDIEITNARLLASSVFSGCGKIQSVSINDGVTSIPSYAFQGCYSLSEVNIPGSVTTIGSYAFSGCCNLNEITLPSKVKTIQTMAFDGCESLYTVYNNSSLPIVKGSYDYGYVAFYAYEVLSANQQSTLQYFDVGDFRFVYLDNQWRLIKCNSDDTNIKFLESFIFDSNESPVTEYVINNNLLRGRNNVESITIPKSVIAIGNQSFSEMSSLKEVIIDSESKLTLIPYHSFAYNPLLETINIPDSIQTIDSYAFTNCQSLKAITIPENVINIYWGAFDNCTNLLDVLNLSNLDIIKGSESFGSVAANALIVRTSTSQSPIKYFNINQFTYAYSDDNLILYKYTPMYDGENITLPSSVTIDNKTYTSYELHNKVFSNQNISSIHIPSSVTKIGNYCFEGCYNLYSVTFDANTRLESIGNGAFSSCSNLHEFGNLEGLKKIGDNAFSWCSNLKEINLPSDLEYIGYSAFYYNSKLRKVILPEKLSTIGYNAFYECIELYEVVNLTYNLNVQKGSTDNGYVAYYALVVNTSLDSEGIYYETIGDYDFMHYGAETILISYNSNEWLTELRLPESITINGKKINDYKIGKYAFRYKSFEKIYIPSSVTEIRDSAFENCSSLKEVEFAKDSKIESIPLGAFRYCNYLQCIVIPSSVTSIGDEAFYNCHSLVDLVIGEKVEKIGSYAFTNCNSLVNIYNYSSLTLSKGSSDYGYVAKNAINIYGKDDTFVRSNVVENGGNIFAQIGSEWYLLTYMYYSNIYNFPTEFYYDGKRINEYNISSEVFIESYSVQQVFIPTSVKQIDKKAFSNCMSLSEIYYEGNEQQWKDLQVDKAVTTGKNLFIYAECIHYYGQWNYDNYSGVNTSVNMVSWTTTKEATCTTEGTATGYCYSCEQNVEKVLPKTSHIYNTDNICTLCGAQHIVANTTTFNELFVNDVNFPFNISSAGLITSTLKEDSKSAELVYTAPYDATISFEYRVSSEASCDKLLIYLISNGAQHTLLEASGEVSYTFMEVELSKGDILKIIYSKDGSSSSGLDRCYIRNFTVN